MVDLYKLPVRDKKGDIHVVVKTPRGSAAKLELDPDLQLFTLSNALILGPRIPTIGVSFHPRQVKMATPSTY
jgi:inorganic pyrophosphatase